MSLTFSLPEGFEYVGAALLSTVFVLFGQSTLVDIHRGLAKIKYPQLYAEKAQMDASKEAYVFNCAQRAHQNTLEKIPIIYAVTLLTGIKYPIVAAFGCAVWSISRISYTRGYLTGNPSKRGTPLSRLGMASTLGLMATSTYIAGGWLWAGFAAKFL